jgi:dTDP-4-amino-4,6-dideoxygalactose transaminase
LAGYTGLYSSGRAAIYSALRSLHLSRDTPVWMPAYHCGVEVQAAIDAGFDVGFYRIRSDLRIDLDDLERRLRARPGPVLVIHYFGFAQPDIAELAAMCRRQGVMCIEDCAHALFSSHRGQALGTFAPLAVFSLRKTLPLCEGGALRVNRELLTEAERRVCWLVPDHGSTVAYRFYCLAVVRQLAGEPAIRLYRCLRRRKTDAPIGWSEAIQERHRYPDRLAAISRRVAASVDPAGILEQRRENWRILDARLAAVPGCGRLFEVLPEGTCPLALVLRVTRRTALKAAFMESGIEAFDWGTQVHPRFDTSEFPDSTRLREEILCLPVHQQLSEVHMKWIAEAAAHLIARHASREASSR